MSWSRISSFDEINPWRRAFSRMRGAVESRSVVLQGDHNIAARVGGGEFDYSAGIFSFALANPRVFQPVINRVTDEVNQGIFQLLKHGCVDFDISSGDFKARHLAMALCQIAYRTHELAK